MSAEQVSTAVRDWILQDVLTQRAAGQPLLHRNILSLPLSVNMNTVFMTHDISGDQPTAQKLNAALSPHKQCNFTIARFKSH